MVGAPGQVEGLHPAGDRDLDFHWWYGRIRMSPPTPVDAAGTGRGGSINSTDPALMRPSACSPKSSVGRRSRRERSPPDWLDAENRAGP
jgi:hypothetical protein